MCPFLIRCFGTKKRQFIKKVTVNLSVAKTYKCSKYKLPYNNCEVDNQHARTLETKFTQNLSSPVERHIKGKSPRQQKETQTNSSILNCHHDYKTTNCNARI